MRTKEVPTKEFIKNYLRQSIILLQQDTTPRSFTPNLSFSKALGKLMMSDPTFTVFFYSSEMI